MAGIVLVHGLGGSASTMEPLADALAIAGHHCRSIQLPGHGADPEDLLGSSWAQWVDAVPPADILVGQSMGASLVLAAAARRDAIRGVVAINAPAADADGLEGLEWRRSRGHTWVDAPALATGELGYTRLPMDALVAMAAGVLSIDLTAVTVPVLLVTSDDDDVVDPASAGLIADSLSRVERLVLHGAGHTASRGPRLAELATAIDAFALRTMRT